MDSVVQIGTAGRKAQTLHPGRCEHATELVGEQRIPVVKQAPLADRKPVHTVGEAACDLRHPRAVRLPHHAVIPPATAAHWQARSAT